jgi:hypothetical protein
MKQKPGPKPKMISLHPFTFDEVLDAVLTSKPKKKEQKQGKEVPEKATKSRKRKAA